MIDGLPVESLFHKWAIRLGDWSETEYVMGRLVNEVALSRADGRGYMPELVKSPMQILHDQASTSYREHRHADTLKELQPEQEERSGDHS